MTKPKFYVTTAIPYVNAKPHIGFALELLQADALARWHRQRGYETFFLTGTDENALKNVQAAESAHQSTAEYVSGMSGLFQKLSLQLGISNNELQTARHLSALIPRLILCGL